MFEEKMKAVVLENYGDPEKIEVKLIEKPMPEDNEVLVKVYFSSVNYNNLGHVTGKPFLGRMWFGLSKPKLKIPGNDIAGIVSGTGKNVTQFKTGDEVYGEICDAGFGGYAEYVCVPEKFLAKKPVNLSFEEAAAVPESALVALHGVRDFGKASKGKKVLIYGASGGIGTFAVQIAKCFETEVTGVCSSKNIELVHSIGADFTIDYTKEDFTGSGKKYDLIITTAGYRSIFDFKSSLTDEGIFLVIGGAMKGDKAMSLIYEAMLLGPLLSLTGKKKLGSLPIVKSTQEDLLFLNKLIESGKVKPVIDSVYQLIDAGKALKYYENRHSTGKIIIKCDDIKN